MLRTGFEQSPMFTGRIQGLGPRYCPSIEDKIDRFSQRERHQIFVEPEGGMVEIYVNGFSSSLPESIQHKALKLVPGFEKVKSSGPLCHRVRLFPPYSTTTQPRNKLVDNLFLLDK